MEKSEYAKKCLHEHILASIVDPDELRKAYIKGFEKGKEKSKRKLDPFTTYIKIESSDHT